MNYISFLYGTIPPPGGNQLTFPDDTKPNHSATVLITDNAIVNILHLSIESLPRI